MSEDLLHRDFHADTPLSKCVTDMTEIPACDGKLYISALFDCYDAGVLGLSIAQGSNPAFGSRQPVHESAVSGGNSNRWDSSKHEQCRWTLS